MKNHAVQWILLGLLITSGFYIVVDHGQHLVPYLPFAFLLGCLFMHLFGHGGHGKHEAHYHNDLSHTPHS